MPAAATWSCRVTWANAAPAPVNIAQTAINFIATEDFIKTFIPRVKKTAWHGVPRRGQRNGQSHRAQCAGTEPSDEKKRGGSGRGRPGNHSAGGARAASGDRRSANTTVTGRTVFRTADPEKHKGVAAGAEGGPPAARHITHCKLWCDPAVLWPSGWLPPSAAAAALQMPPSTTGWTAGAATATPIANANHTRTRRARVRE